MQDSITFLGTGGGRYVMADQSRGTAGVIIKAEGEQIHLDPGPGILRGASKYGISLKDTSIILVSHDHTDHVNDLNLAIDVMTVGGLAKKGTLLTTGTALTNCLRKYAADSLEDFRKIQVGEKVRIGKIQIEAMKTINHSDSIGFKIMTPKFVVGYTSDTGYFSEIGTQFAGCDILIINNMMPFSFKKKLEIHLKSEDTKKILEKAKPSLAILTHFSHHMLEANPMYEARDLQKLTGVQVIAATDGLVIEPTSYSANSKQKNLMGFE